MNAASDFLVVLVEFSVDVSRILHHLNEEKTVTACVIRIKISAAAPIETER